MGFRETIPRKTLPPKNGSCHSVCSKQGLPTPRKVEFQCAGDPWESRYCAVHRGGSHPGPANHLTNSTAKRDALEIIVTVPWGNLDPKRLARKNRDGRHGKEKPHVRELQARQAQQQADSPPSGVGRCEAEDASAVRKPWTAAKQESRQEEMWPGLHRSCPGLPSLELEPAKLREQQTDTGESDGVATQPVREAIKGKNGPGRTRCGGNSG